jgi:hypothetical protein
MRFDKDIRDTNNYIAPGLDELPLKRDAKRAFSSPLVPLHLAV